MTRFLSEPELRFVRASMQQPLLSRDKEYEYALEWRNSRNERALHCLVNSYIRLVIGVAARFKNYGLPLPDLIQEGTVGLMLAAERFDTAREVRFSTYARWWIRSCIQDYVLRNWSIVRTGTTAAQKSLFFNLRRLRARIEEESAAAITSEGHARIATTLGVPVEEVEKMEIRLGAPDTSLNVPIDQSEETGYTLQDLLEDDRPLPEQVVMENCDAAAHRRWLEVAFEALSTREQHIIRERCLTEEAKTLQVLGEELGVSKERVRQLELRALSKLRQELTAVVNPAELF